MPQTILAMLALMTAVLFTMGTHRQVIETEREMVANELEVMATGIALEAMEKIRTRAFDQVVAEDPNKVYTESQFEPSSNWNNTTCKPFHGSGAANDCNDLDDFHGMNSATLTFTMGKDASGNDITVPFTVDVEVTYVDSDLNPVSGNTYQKQVTVFVQDQQTDNRPFLREPVYISRIYAYNFGGNEEGHGGGSEGHAQGEGKEDFEQFMEWLMEKLDENPKRDDGIKFRKWAEGEAEDQADKAKARGNDKMEDAWDDLADHLKKRRESDIEEWFNRYSKVRDHIMEQWYDGSL